MSLIDVIVGTLGRAHGLSGELFIDLRTDSPKRRFAKGSTLWVNGQALTVRGFRTHGSRAVVRFDGIGDRTQAEELTGSDLVAWVDSAESTEEPDVYFDHQLIGLDVVTTHSVVAGTVIRVDHCGAQDLLAVETTDGERLVPFVGDLVPEVDLENGQIIVLAIPGLLEDGS
jgi:16S rRNA processing protein RimM